MVRREATHQVGRYGPREVLAQENALGIVHDCYVAGKVEQASLPVYDSSGVCRERTKRPVWSSDTNSISTQRR